MSPLRLSARRSCGAVVAFAALLLSATGTPAGPASEDDIPTGPLGLKELIAIALKNDQKLVELRGNITIEEAKRIAEKDWRDPELRIGRNWDNDVELQQPYDERRVEQASDSIKRTTKDPDETVVERGSSTLTETTNRRVTPGANSDVIRESVSRREVTKLKGPDGLETRTDVIQRDAYQERFHGQDPLARDDDYSFRLRFYPPHPWERKARLKRADARIGLAKAELHAAEREVISWVRRQYEKLQYLRQMMSLTERGVSIDKGFAEDMQTLMKNGATTLDKVGFAKMDTINSTIDAEDARVAYENELGELAWKLGIISVSRIHISANIARPNIPVNSRDLEYYIQMAFASRGELKEIVSRGQISEGDLAVAKSKYIPWFSYMQVHYGVENTGGQQTSDNYGFQVGVTLPFFTWLGREKAVHEAAVESLYSQMGAAKQQITAQVTEAYRAVRRTASLKARVAENQKAMGAELDKAVEFAQDAVDSKKLNFEAAKKKLDLSESMLSAHRHYNEALIRFEEALGVDVNEVFSSPTLEASATPMNEPPAALPGMPKDQRPKSETNEEKQTDAKAKGEADSALEADSNPSSEAKPRFWRKLLPFQRSTKPPPSKKPSKSKKPSRRFGKKKH